MQISRCTTSILSCVLALSSCQALSSLDRGSIGAEGHRVYVPPVSNPLFHETAHITTELRPMAMQNEIPDDFLTQGGDIRVYAAQARLALDDRLGFIATKDGYADLDFNAALPDESGLVNVAAGLKYAFHSEPEAGEIASVGVKYEAPVGDLETGGISLQGDGDGFLDLFVAGEKRWERVGIAGNAGLNWALDGDHDSSMAHYAVHADYAATESFYPLVELNGYTTVSEGSRLPGVDFEGLDLVNFGSESSGTVVTWALGFRQRLNEHALFGVAYEDTLTSREDILERRVIVDLVLHL